MESSFVFLFNISHFSSINNLEAMSKEHQKMQPMMNLVSRYSVKDPNVLASTSLESPKKAKYES